jgi:transposase
LAGGAIEIITGRERRWRWSVEGKLRIVAETNEPGARVTEVAARHGVYPGLLVTWRRQVRDGVLVAAQPAAVVPVRMLEPVQGLSTE